MTDNIADRLENLPADNGVMVVFLIELVYFPMIQMPSEPEVRIGFLIKAVSLVPLISQDPEHRGCSPCAFSLGWNLLLIQRGSNLTCALPRQSLIENKPHPFRLILFNDKFPVSESVAVWRIAEFEGAVLKAVPYSPLAVLGNRN